MKVNPYFKVLCSFLIATYVLAACGGTFRQATTSAGGPGLETNVVAILGTVEAISGTQWTIGGQTLTLDPRASLDPNITVGDQVKVEANVLADGSVVALKVESTAAGGPVVAVATSSAAANASGTSAPSSIPAAGVSQNEIVGTVESITADTITVNGVTYNLIQGFTEIKDPLAVGDQVMVHVILNADGTFTIGEIQTSVATAVNQHSGHSSGSDDGANQDLNHDDPNSSGNASDDGPNHDSNDGHGPSGSGHD